MMKFQDLASGVAMYVDPNAIYAVMPAVDPPKPGIAPGQHIPVVRGSQLFIAGLQPLYVRGLPDELALKVAVAKVTVELASAD